MFTILLLDYEQIQRLSPPRLGPFSAVTVLAFFKVISPSMDEFTELLCCFPRLCILSINMSFWVRDNSESRVFKTRGCPPVELHTLNVGLHMPPTRMMGFSWLFRWFLEKGMPPLSTVRLHGFPNEEVACIGEALQKLRNSLQFLELELGIRESVEDGPLEVGGIDLGHHHNLRSLSILEGHPTALYRLLKTMTSPSVLEETKLSVNSEGVLSAINCSDLDRLLSSTGFRTIQLDIGIMYHEEDSRQVEKIKSYFPMCSAREKVRITAGNIASDGQFEGFITSRWRDPALAAAGRAVV